jgi:hypothetical protein
MALGLHYRATVRAGWLLMGLISTGCITVYQPLVGLQRPIAIDPYASNTFEGNRLHVRCHQGDGVEADALCRNLRTAFGKQGAQVTTEVVRQQGRAPAATTNPEPPQYVMDVTSRRVAENPGGLLGALICGFSFTLIPVVDEYTFAQDVVIRDRQGFILAQQTFQERFVESFGFGVWALNGLIDLIVRPKTEQVTGDRYKEEFTRDLHGHLGQLLYNANVRARVMGSFAPEAPKAEAASEKPKGSAP